MATRRYSIASGQTEFQIVEAVGAPTVTASMEFTFDLGLVTHKDGVTAVLEKREILQALEMIKNHIITSKLWPPA